MKHLKYFTGRANALKEARAGLERNGVAPQHIHTFVRRNDSHRYDGLLLQTDKDHEEKKLRQGVLFWAVMFLFSSVLIQSSLLSLTEAFGLVFLVSLITLVAKFPFRGNAKKQRGKLDCVYFLVVDVDQKNSQKIHRLAMSHPDLTAQDNYSDGAALSSGWESIRANFSALFH